MLIIFNNDQSFEAIEHSKFDQQKASLIKSRDRSVRSHSSQVLMQVFPVRPENAFELRRIDTVETRTHHGPHLFVFNIAILE